MAVLTAAAPLGTLKPASTTAADVHLKRGQTEVQVGQASHKRACASSLRLSDTLQGKAPSALQRKRPLTASSRGGAEFIFVICVNF